MALAPCWESCESMPAWLDRTLEGEHLFTSADEHKKRLKSLGAREMKESMQTGDSPQPHMHKENVIIQLW